MDAEDKILIENLIPFMPSAYSEEWAKKCLPAIKQYADIKLGKYISQQSSSTQTLEVPKYILEEYANLSIIEVLEGLSEKMVYIVDYDEIKEKIFEIKSQPIVIEKDDLKIVPSVGGGYGSKK